MPLKAELKWDKCEVNKRKGSSFEIVSREKKILGSVSWELKKQHAMVFLYHTELYLRNNELCRMVSGQDSRYLIHHFDLDGLDIMNHHKPFGIRVYLLENDSIISFRLWFFSIMVVEVHAISREKGPYKREEKSMVTISQLSSKNHELKLLPIRPLHKIFIVRTMKKLSL